ncbi:MAG: DUF4390 domain-containing protein [Methylomarinum sp.]|nr:DUF4390 domain-containing protein [Methylomarinum sp.]
MKIYALIAMLGLMSGQVGAEVFSASIQHVDVELIDSQYELNADIDYKLSHTAKEALYKGIPLAWSVLVEVKREGFLWDSTLNEIALKYQIQNHALLNLFSVKNINKGSKEMFSTLTAALNAMSRIRRLKLVDNAVIKPVSDYYVAIKVEFSREALPIPLRPLSYFDSQWALSSDWELWPLQN